MRPSRHLRHTSQSAIARSPCSSLRNSSSHKVDQEPWPRRHEEARRPGRGRRPPMWRTLLRGTGVRVPPRPSADPYEGTGHSHMPWLAGREAARMFRRSAGKCGARCSMRWTASFIALTSPGWRGGTGCSDPRLGGIRRGAWRKSLRATRVHPCRHCQSHAEGVGRDLHVCLPYETASLESQTRTTV
jgi:hypothetical protein